MRRLARVVWLKLGLRQISRRRGEAQDGFCAFLTEQTLGAGLVTSAR